MARIGRAIALGLVMGASLLIAEIPTRADDPTASPAFEKLEQNGVTTAMREGVVRGSFVLTGQTMQSLLDAGFAVVGVNTPVILQHFEGPISFYLQSGPLFYRCTEGGPHYGQVFCWKFQPQMGEIGGIKQTNAPFNNLQGSWAGTYIAPNGAITPVHVAFKQITVNGQTTETMTTDLPNWTKPVIIADFKVGVGEMVAVAHEPPGRALDGTDYYDFVFRFVGEDKVSWDNSQVGPIVLRKS